MCTDCGSPALAETRLLPRRRTTVSCVLDDAAVEFDDQLAKVILFARAQSDDDVADARSAFGALDQRALVPLAETVDALPDSPIAKSLLV
jgi:hypothetical protein